MTVNRKGFAAIANKTFSSAFRSNLKDALIEGHNEIFVGRVTDIIFCLL